MRLNGLDINTTNNESNIPDLSSAQDNAPENKYDNAEDFSSYGDYDAFNDDTSDSVEREELNKLLAERKERYADQKYHSRFEGKTISKNMMIGIIIGIFVYYITFFILNALGVISLLVMSCFIVPVTIAAIIFYFLSWKKNQ